MSGNLAQTLSQLKAFEAALVDEKERKKNYDTKPQAQSGIIPYPAFPQNPEMPKWMKWKAWTDLTLKWIREVKELKTDRKTQDIVEEMRTIIEGGTFGTTQYAGILPLWKLIIQANKPKFDATCTVKPVPYVNMTEKATQVRLFYPRIQRHIQSMMAGTLFERKGDNKTYSYEFQDEQFSDKKLTLDTNLFEEENYDAKNTVGVIRTSRAILGLFSASDPWYFLLPHIRLMLQQIASTRFMMIEEKDLSPVRLKEIGVFQTLNLDISGPGFEPAK